MNQILRFLRKHFRLVTVAGALLVSCSFFALRNPLISLAGIEITAHLGQERGDAEAFFGIYSEQVENLIENGSFLRNGAVLNRYPPVYPAILYFSYSLSAAIGVDIGIVLMLAAAVFIALSALCIGETAFLVYGRETPAIVAGLLFATHPYVLQGLTKTMSETPFMAFFFAAVWLLVKGLVRPAERAAERGAEKEAAKAGMRAGRRAAKAGMRAVLQAALMGVLLGVAMLIRPMGLFLPIVFATAYGVFSTEMPIVRRAAGAAAIVLGAVLAIAPWQAFNWRHGENILLSSDRVHSIVDGVSFNNHPGKQRIRLPADIDAAARRLSTGGVRTRGEFFSLALREFRDRPAAMVKLGLIKAARSWYGVWAQEARKERIKMGISLLYLIAAGIGLLRLRKAVIRAGWGGRGGWSGRPARIYLAVFVLLTAYFWGMTILVVSMVRYMIPVFGLMAVVTAGVVGGGGRQDPMAVGLDAEAESNYA